MVFLNFFTFFAIFLEFYITRWVGTKRRNNFIFLSFSAFSNLFWLEMKPQPYFLIFLILWLFYWNFLLRVGLERNGTIIFIFYLSLPFPTYCGWNEAIMVFLIYWIFLLFFWNFVLRMGLEWNGTIIFIFSRSHSLQPYFGFKRSHNCIL